MSLLISLLFALIGFIFSWTGVFAFLVGVLLFVLTPTLSLVTGIKKFARLHIYLAMWAVKRGAVVVSEHNDLLWKSMEFDDIGVEKITFGTDTKEFEDPATALHHFMGFPFALADEVHGLLFDPRHAAIGDRKKQAEERNEMYVRATGSEWDAYEVYGWVRGVFELPKKHELVDLSRVRQIVTGTERAEYPTRIETMYKNSRMPYADKTPLLRMALPVIAFLGVFGAIWFMASQGNGGSGGGGSTVGYSSLLLLLSAPSLSLADIRERLQDAWNWLEPRLKSTASSGADTASEVDWRRLGGILALVLPLPLAFLAVAAVAGVIKAVLAFIVIGMGYWTLPLLTVFARPSDRLSGMLSQLYLMLGFLGYQQPVFEWTPAKYRLREFEDLDDTTNVKWYGLANSLVGFTFQPDEDAWGQEVIGHTEVDSRKEALADGGAASNIPSGYTRYPDMQRAVYGAFVPNRIKRHHYYLHSGITLSRFTDAAIGEKSLRKLLAAKEKYGEDGWGVSDSTLMWLTFGAAILAAVLGVFVFFL